MAKRLLIALLISCLVLAVPYHAAADSAIDITAEDEAQFPDSLTFGVGAVDLANETIDRVLLRYRIEGVTDIRVTTIVPVPFEEGPVVEAEWTWDMRKAALPPGAVISYSWLVEDSAGSTAESEWDTVVFEDDRHDWSSIEEGNVTLLWYRGGQAFSRELIDAATDSLETLAMDTGSYLEDPVQVFVYDGSRALREALIHQPEWIGGAAFTHFGIVVIGIAPEDLAWGTRAMTHELAHLVTYQMTSNPYNDIPTWLNEGLSVYAEGAVDLLCQTALNDAVEQDNLISLKTLSSNFPADIDEARLSYAESRSVVEFLIDEYGRDKISELLAVFQEGATYDGALEEVYGFGTAALENQWRASLGLGPRPTPSPTSAPAVDTPTSCAKDTGARVAKADLVGAPLFILVGLMLMSCFGWAMVDWLRSRRHDG